MKKGDEYRVTDWGAVFALIGFVLIALVVIGGMVVLGIML